LDTLDCYWGNENYNNRKLKYILLIDTVFKVPGTGKSSAREERWGESRKTIILTFWYNNNFTN
jgi:hypothetical protein